MILYGQRRIIKEIDLLAQDILHNNGKFNIIFRAPSGYGKTALATNFANIIGMEKVAYYIASKDMIKINTNKSLQIIDEVHLIENPEFLYPFMDSGEYNFLLLSNLSGGMKEAFRNRCIEFIFDPYTNEDMEQIVGNFLQKYHLNQDLILRIVPRTRNNPRVAKIICERLQYIFNNYLVPKSVEELETILNNILYIREDGLNRQDDLYLDFLRRTGICSLETLSRGTGLDKETIQREIEPFLLYSGLIKITSRGRIINERRNNN